MKSHQFAWAFLYIFGADACYYADRHINGTLVGSDNVPFNHNLSPELSERFGVFIARAYPGIYDIGEQGEGVRQSQPFECACGHQSRTRLIDMYSSVPQFLRVSQPSYSVPNIVPLPQSEFFAESIAVLIQVIPQCGASSWFHQSEWDENFDNTQLYQLVKDIPVDSTTIGVAFPPTLLKLMTATSDPGNLHNVDYIAQHLRSRQLFDYLMLAIDAAGSNITRHMVLELLAFMMRLKPFKEYALMTRTPNMEYAGNHPNAIALRTVIPQKYNTIRVDILGQPSIDWDTLVVTQDDVDEAASTFFEVDQHGDPIRGSFRDERKYLAFESFCEFVRRSGLEHECVGSQQSGRIDETILMVSLPFILSRALSNTVMVAILSKVDLALIAFDAAKNGYMPRNGNIYHLEGAFNDALREWLNQMFNF